LLLQRDGIGNNCTIRRFDLGFFNFGKSKNKKKKEETSKKSGELPVEGKKDKKKKNQEQETILIPPVVEEKPKASPKSTVFGMATPLLEPLDEDGSDEESAPAKRVVSGSMESSIPETSDSNQRAVSGEIGSSSEDRMETMQDVPSSDEDSVPQEESTDDLTEKMEAAPVMVAENAADDPKSVLNILRGTDFSNDDLFGGGSGEVEPEELDRSKLVSHIECQNCSRQLPVPFVGYPAKITCPFCLNINEYNV
jgi:hypothetical protein